MLNNTPSAWATWALASLFYAYQYILRVAPNILLPDITLKYELSASVTGQFSGAYYLGYAVAHIPLGIMLDRFGPKRILPLFMALTVVGMAPLVLTDIWLFPILGRVLVGIGSSCAILGVFKIIRMGFHEQRFTWLLSLAVTIGLIGAIFGGGPLDWMYQNYGMDKVVALLMVAGAILSVLTYALLPHTPALKVESGVMKNVISVLKNKTVLAICVLAGFLVGPLDGFTDVWGSTFLRTVYGLDVRTAAYLPSFVFFGMCFGGPILSIVARKTRNDLGVIFVCALVMLLAFVVLLLGVIPSLALAGIFFVVGIACAYQIIAIAYASTRVPAEQMGLTSAIANMIIMAFGYVIHAGIGAMVSYFNNGAVHIDAYPAKALIYGIAVIPVALAIGALGFFVLAKMRAKAQIQIGSETGDVQSRNSHRFVEFGK